MCLLNIFGSLSATVLVFKFATDEIRSRVVMQNAPSNISWTVLRRIQKKTGPFLIEHN